MAITLSNLSPAKGSKHTKKRVGRGDGSGRGTYSGRGQKGQRSRSGGKKGLKLKGIRRNIRNFPKLRGFKSKSKKPEIVHIEDIYTKFSNDDTIDPQKLKKAGFIKGQNIKVLCKTPLQKYGTGKNKDLTKDPPSHKATAGQGEKKLTISAHAFSKKAMDYIEKNKGRAIIID